MFVWVYLYTMGSMNNDMYTNQAWYVAALNIHPQYKDIHIAIA